MKQLLGIITFLLFSCMACQDNKPKINSVEIENISQEQIDSVLQKFNFEYENPIVLDSGRQILIPISTELLDKNRGLDSYSKGYPKGYPRYWNVLFFNNQTGETKLLTDEKYWISTIAAPKDELDYNNELKVLQDHVLYHIIDEDYNKDEKLNHLDPGYLFVSDLDGSNLKKLSPENEDLMYYKIIPHSKQIIIETRRDADNDSLFTRKDELIWYQTELIDNEWKIKELIEARQRKKIENLYFEQWLKKK